MSLTVRAMLFYGYNQPESDKERYRDIDHNEEDTPWSATHTASSHGCVGEIQGYDENLGYFLAVKESLYKANWDQIKPLGQKDFEVRPEWDGQLQEAAAGFGLDLTGLQPGWYLVCLYF